MLSYTYQEKEYSTLVTSNDTKNLIGRKRIGVLQPSVDPMETSLNYSSMFVQDGLNKVKNWDQNLTKQ